jgi:hypothetical protein
MLPAQEQVEICARIGAEFLECAPESKMGIALQTLSMQPLHGLRHTPSDGTCGWYVWAGEELGVEPHFFQPIHVSHLSNRCPMILPYLGLAPGWRFIIAPGYEDVWFDPTLLAHQHNSV